MEQAETQLAQHPKYKVMIGKETSNPVSALPVSMVSKRAQMYARVPK